MHRRWSSPSASGSCRSSFDNQRNTPARGSSTACPASICRWRVTITSRSSRSSRGPRERFSGPSERWPGSEAEAWLFAEPDRIELVVQVVAGRDRPAAHLAEVGDDPVPLKGVDVVHLFVVEALLEGAEQLPPLFRLGGAGLLRVEVIHHRVLVLAEVH